MKSFFGYLFIGICIIVGLNFNYFLEKSSDVVYVLSGQQAEDIKKAEIEKEKEKLYKKIRLEKEINKKIKNLELAIDKILDDRNNYFSNDETSKLFKINFFHNKEINNELKECSYYGNSSKNYIEFKNLDNTNIKKITMMLKVTNEDNSIEYFKDKIETIFDYVVEKNESRKIRCPKASPSDFKMFREKNALVKYIVIKINEKYNLDYLSEFRKKSSYSKGLNIQGLCTIYSDYSIELKYDRVPEVEDHCALINSYLE